MAIGGGVEIGGPNGLNVKIPDWTAKKLWEKKIRSWMSLIKKGCPARTGPGVGFCSWAGHACYYNACPRRIFEEVAVVEEAIPQPTPSPEFVQQFKQMQKQLNKMGQGLKKTREEVGKIKKELEET